MVEGLFERVFDVGREKEGNTSVTGGGGVIPAKAGIQDFGGFAATRGFPLSRE